MQPAQPRKQASLWKYVHGGLFKASPKGQDLAQGKPAQFLGPEGSFTYLGVDITMTLNWNPQLTKMTDKLSKELDKLSGSLLLLDKQWR
eukprot:456734-Pelagomonas_calceolata.AAC.1